MNETVQVHDPSSVNIAVTVTEAALKHFKKQLTNHENAKGIRLGTKKAGCSGLKYVIDFVSQPDEDELSFTIEPAFTVFVPRTSFPYIKGSVIDYVKEGLNGAVRIHNPNEKGSCGCGESFSTQVDV